MLLCLDSSALVKLLVEEQGSELVARLWDGADARLASRLVEPEVAAALHAARRDGRLSRRALEGARSAWQEHLPALRIVEVTPGVASRSAELTAAHALGGADAVHLASVLLVQQSDPVLAVFDKRLHTAAGAAGLRTAPAVL